MLESKDLNQYEVSNFARKVRKIFQINSVTMQCLTSKAGRLKVTDG